MQMIPRVVTAGIALIVLQSPALADIATEAPPPRIPMVMEKLPPNLRVDPRTLATRKQRGNPRWVTSKPWPPGKTVRVAFYGGTPELHKKISEIAPEWTKYGNVKLDFGFDSATQKFRSWSPSDQDYAAEIRIAFIKDDYWSALGTDSIDREAYGPGDPSMNLQIDFTPDFYWQRVILHEFGHAFGFEHEHQHPRGACDDEFKWDDEPGYQTTWTWIGPEPDDIVYVADNNGHKPGVYTNLIGAPNKWIPGQVDSQMRQIQPSSAYSRKVTLGPVDRKSIMHYHFQPDFFKKGADSPCCVGEYEALSDFDKEGMKTNYP